MSRHKCNKGIFSCDYCSYVAGRSDALARHVKTFHSGNNNSNSNDNNNSAPVQGTSANSSNNIPPPAIAAASSNNRPPASVVNSSNNNRPTASEVNSSNNRPPASEVNSSNNNIPLASEVNSSNNRPPSVGDSSSNNRTQAAVDNSNNNISSAKIRKAVKKPVKKKASSSSAVKAGVTGMLTFALLSGCAAPVPVPPGNLSPDAAVATDVAVDEDWEWLEASQPSERRGRGRPPGRTPHVCPKCNFAATTHRRLLGHLRKHDRAAKLHFCKHNCGQSSMKPSDIRKHETTCVGRPQVPNQLDADTIWEILSLCPLRKAFIKNDLEWLEMHFKHNFNPLH